MDKYRFRLLFFVGFLVLTFLFSGCEQTKFVDAAPRQLARKVERPTFGESGAGRIAVMIRGDVKHPGRYYLDEGANLDSVLSVFGGWGDRGDGGAPPTKAKLTRANGSKSEYRFWKMTKEEREAVRLQDGDTLSFPTIIF